MLFRTRARRNQMLAAWAASKLGRANADAYLKEVQLVDAAVSGDDDILQKILADLRSAGQKVDEDDLHSMMNEMMFDAAEELEAERQRAG
ncbi:ATPase inhibitor subunit zeta [Rhizobium sp. F40D2]|uniref:ATPase inhibitor subunit zeta n=1 Tax=Rhizobium sp. F40D2 TaxID=3453141 RepID=UPI003F219607